MNNEKKITLFSLVWPLFMEMVLRMLLGNVNVFVLSKYSDNAVGAVGLANNIMSMIIVMYSIIGMGTSIAVSQYVGAQRKDLALKVANVAFFTNFVFSLALSLVITVFARSIFSLMRVPDELIDYAYTYTVIVGAASFTQALIAIMGSIVRNYGYTRLPMYVAIGMNALNIIGNFIVVFKPFGFPEFGVAGVAVSLVISEISGVIVMFIMLKNVGINFHIKNIRPFPLDILKNIVKVGFPAAGEYISYTLSSCMVTVFVSILGAAMITTRVYIGNIAFFVSALGLAIGQSSQILIGQMVGAGDSDDAYRRCLKSLKLAALSNFILSLIMVGIGKYFLSLFTANSTIIKTGCALLIVDVFVELGRAFNNVLMSSLRGAGDVRFPVIVAIPSMWLFSVAMGYTMGIYLGLGMIGIWIAAALDEWCRGLILMGRWHSKLWQKNSLINVKSNVLIK